MKVGLLTLEIRFPAVTTLKEKRSILHRMIAAIERRGPAFAAAEIAHLDDRDRATIRIAHLSNDPRYTDAALRRVQAAVETGRGYQVEDATLEII